MKISAFDSIRGKFVAAVLLLACGTLPLAQAEPDHRGLVYEIRSESATIYLVGSIHVLRKQDYPLPAVMDRVYEQSNALIMELDLDDIDQVESARLIRQLAMAPAGSSLKSMMGEASFSRSRQRALEIGIDLERLNEVRPWFAALTVLQHALLQAGYSPDIGVEEYYVRLASRDHKSIVGLETMEQQLTILATMSDADQVLFLEKTLAEIEQLESEIGDLMRSWKSGDEQAMQTLLLDSFDAYPKLFEELVNNRNLAWESSLAAILNNQTESHMVIVGALHLLGDRGVVELLRRHGFDVKRL